MDLWEKWQISLTLVVASVTLVTTGCATNGVNQSHPLEWKHSNELSVLAGETEKKMSINIAYSANAPQAEALKIFGVDSISQFGKHLNGVFSGMGYAMVTNSSPVDIELVINFDEATFNFVSSSSGEVVNVCLDFELINIKASRSFNYKFCRGFYSNQSGLTNFSPTIFLSATIVNALDRLIIESYSKGII